VHGYCEREKEPGRAEQEDKRQRLHLDIHLHAPQANLVIIHEPDMFKPSASSAREIEKTKKTLIVDCDNTERGEPCCSITALSLADVWIDSVVPGAASATPRDRLNAGACFPKNLSKVLELHIVMVAHHLVPAIMLEEIASLKTSHFS
ncbi:hypothetical protein Q2941_45430, partial [Bradyrhizobium sp. UFLA05-153]